VDQIKTLDKNGNFGQKWKFWTKIEIFDKHRTFWTKIEIFAQHRNFWTKIEIGDK